MFPHLQKDISANIRIMADDQHATIGRGATCFRLGDGPDATGGNISIELHYIAGTTAEVSVEWLASSDVLPIQARWETTSYIEGYLRGYLMDHPVGSLRAKVVSAGWFTDRRNELDRAAWNALHMAIIDAKLPAPRLYASPDEDPDFFPK